jgi:hypothetical protein
MTKGLPEKMGKMAIAVSRSNSEKVYALIEGDSYSTARGLYASTDAGTSWSQVSSDARLVQRAWYYIEVFVDPKDENRVYVLSAPMLRSNDGGRTWENVKIEHGDTHNLWINPQNPDNLILSDDGGASITFDRGKSWSRRTTSRPRSSTASTSTTSSPTGSTPPSRTILRRHRQPRAGSGGIGTSSWTSTAGGESAFLAFDPDDPRTCSAAATRAASTCWTRARPAPTSCRPPSITSGATRDEVPVQLECAHHLGPHEHNTFYPGPRS